MSSEIFRGLYKHKTCKAHGHHVLRLRAFSACHSVSTTIPPYQCTYCNSESASTSVVKSVSVGVPADRHRDKHIPYAGRAKLTRAQAHYRFSDTDGSLQAGPRRHSVESTPGQLTNLADRGGTVTHIPDSMTQRHRHRLLETVTRTETEE